MNICKDYNIKPEDVLEMYEYDLIIYSLIKEKESFENWWNINID